jgi:hypothetical protein
VTGSAWGPAAARARQTQLVTSSDAYYATLGSMRRRDEPEPVGGLCRPEHPRWRLVDGDPGRTVCGVCHPPVAHAPERVVWVGLESPE